MTKRKVLLAWLMMVLRVLGVLAALSGLTIVVMNLLGLATGPWAFR